MLMILFCLASAAQQHITGTLPDGATYVIDTPSYWNGTLLLYSHGYNPGPGNPAYDAGDGSTATFLLQHNYALAGSSYSTTGWAVHEALPDQIATLDVFESLFGTPNQTIAWGHSMGGIITAGLLQQYPDRFAGGMPMCGVVAGGVGFFNELLDAAFTFNTLVAGNSLQVANISDPTTDYNNAEAWLGYAQGTPQGQARIALTAAMADVPGWWDPGSPEPAQTDYAARELNQFYWLAYDVFPFAFYYRAELEGRAGGNPSWNTGVYYNTQLQHSVDNAEVQALYAAAGLSLNLDIGNLNLAARVSADSGAENYLIQNIIFNGQIPAPVLALHTTGDGLVPVEDEQAYLATAAKGGNKALVRDVFVHRAGHCTFTPAETITAVEALLNRMSSGQWTHLSPGFLNNQAVNLGPSYNYLYLDNQDVYTAPAFETYKSPVFLRPFNAFSH
ncbi:MAG: prolyl oligopeptidase family serine peptidase [Terriglobales bacterium]|jgi:pimeloyl-ACP methyl ester carboxylesterase